MNKTFFEQLQEVKKELKSRIKHPSGEKRENASSSTQDRIVVDSKVKQDKVDLRRDKAKSKLGVKSSSKVQKSRHNLKAQKRAKKHSGKRNQKRATRSIQHPELALINQPSVSNLKDKTDAPTQNRKCQKLFELPTYQAPDRTLIKQILENEKIDGIQLTFVDAENHEARTQYIYLGLDFGTAFTKVVVGDVSEAFAIPFGEDEFLLPSKVFVSASGQTSLTPKNNYYCMDELKLPLIRGESVKEDHIVIVCFIALVFQKCRDWAENAKESKYKGVKKEWIVNGGLPSANYENDTLVQTYQDLISAAWTLSYVSEITIQNALEVIQVLVSNKPSIKPDMTLAEHNLMLVPEFAAQVVGYVQSSFRRKYSHLLVDVGAGTLDCVMFALDENDGEWRYKTYDQAVETLGAEILKQHRQKNIETNNPDNYSSEQWLDETVLNEVLGVSLEELEEIDFAFKNAVSSTIYNTIDNTNNFYGGGRGKYVEPITTFFCGGGSGVGLYKKAYETVKRTYTALDLIQLPKPERLKTKMATKDYHRLSVAFGLSFDPFNIGDILKQQAEEYRSKADKFEPSSYLLYTK